VLNDLEQVPESWANCIVAVNDIGTELPVVDHWVTLHPEHFPEWEPKAIATDYVRWSRPFPSGEHRGQWTDRHADHWGGTSGLFGARVALALGAAEVVLAGIPMQAGPHYWGGPVWEPTQFYLKDWQRYKDKLANVRSLSGWTRELLGAPEWANG